MTTTSTREPAQCPPGIHSTADPCPGNCTLPLPETEPCPPRGPHAARAIAREHAAAGHHVHLVSDAMDRCVSGHCKGMPELLRGTA